MNTGVSERLQRTGLPGVGVVRKAVAGLSDHGSISRSRVVMALKAGVSSIAAWYAAQLIPGAAAYAYFAPFGVVIAMTFSIAGSVRQITRAFAAICIGVGLAIGSEFVIQNSGLSVGMIVFVGIVVSAWPPLGLLGSWVPFTALFVLIVGGDSLARYVASYVGLTLLGGAIATAVNILVPPMPASAFGPVERRIRSRIADQYEHLAGQLRDPDGDEDSDVLAPLLTELWAATDRTHDARRINPRARLHRNRVQKQYEDADRLERLIYLAQETGELVSQLREEHASSGLDERARDDLGAALECLASELRRADDDLRARRQDVAELNSALRRIRDAESGQDDWLLLSILTSVRRSSQLLVPAAFKR